MILCFPSLIVARFIARGADLQIEAKRSPFCHKMCLLWVQVYRGLVGFGKSALWGPAPLLKIFATSLDSTATIITIRRRATGPKVFDIMVGSIDPLVGRVKSYVGPCNFQVSFPC